MGVLITIYRVVSIRKNDTVQIKSVNCFKTVKYWLLVYTQAE